MNQFEKALKGSQRELELEVTGSPMGQHRNYLAEGYLLATVTECASVAVGL